MDEIPVLEPELDTFSLILPLPYRIAVTFVLGTSASLQNDDFKTDSLLLSRRLGLGRQPPLLVHTQNCTSRA